jgi:hypothetical protein
MESRQIIARSNLTSIGGLAARGPGETLMSLLSSQAELSRLSQASRRLFYRVGPLYVISDEHAPFAKAEFMHEGRRKTIACGFADDGKNKTQFDGPIWKVIRLYEDGYAKDNERLIQLINAADNRQINSEKDLTNASDIIVKLSGEPAKFWLNNANGCVGTIEYKGIKIQVDRIAAPIGLIMVTGANGAPFVAADHFEQKATIIYEGKAKVVGAK